VKRFYKQAGHQPTEEGHAITLDGRPVKTPARAALVVPSPALADGIAREWNAQGDRIDPRSMPLTGLANAAIDRVAVDAETFARGLSAYAETDLLAYRADHPADLVARQAASWDPIIDWARQRFDIAFTVTSGIVHQPQPPATLDRLHNAVATQTPFALAGLHPIVTISGSLLIALALAEGVLDADQAWQAGHLDELWQAEKWGDDPLAAKTREAHRRDFDNGVLFLSLVGQG